MRYRHSQKNNATQMQQRNIDGLANQQKGRGRNQQPLLAGDYMSLEFRYNFQDYLKMALCKMVPQEGILFNQREGFIYGPREECIKLKKKVQKELTSRKYKKIEFKKDADLDEIDYELDCKFQARIFRSGFIERALTAISEFDGLEKPCSKFRKAIADGKTIILRVKSDFEEECMEKIDLILKGGSKEKPKEVVPPEQEEEYEEIVEECVNYYQMMQAEKNQEVHCQKILEQLNQSKVFSQPESSFTLTQTDSSHLMEQQPDSLFMDQSSKASKSFM